MTPEQIERHVDAAAAALGLPLSPAHREGVLRYFALASLAIRLAAFIGRPPKARPERTAPPPRRAPTAAP
ncbi:AtzG-like protein, partial [Variovorax sp. CT11-76]